MLNVLFSWPDLGWNSWVIHPDSLTVIECALCNSEGNPVQYLSTHSNVQGADPQVPIVMIFGSQVLILKTFGKEK